MEVQTAVRLNLKLQGIGYTPDVLGDANDDCMETLVPELVSELA